MNIAGHPVLKQDTVVHLIYGTGIVQSVQADRCVVLFASGPVTVFDGGTTGGQRTVFWQDIRLLDPPKDSNTWQVMLEVALRVRQG